MNLDKESKDLFRVHFLNILSSLKVDAMFLAFLYSYPDQGGMIGRAKMEDLMWSREENSLRTFRLLLVMSRKGFRGFKALVEAMVFTGQEVLADQVHEEISRDFSSRKNEYYPYF